MTSVDTEFSPTPGRPASDPADPADPACLPEPASRADQSEPTRAAQERWRHETQAVLATLALTLLALTFVMQLWRASPGVPFTAEGDAAFVEMTVQNIIDTGWFQNAPRLGAPFRASLHDFPQGGDNLQFALIRGLAFFSSDAGTVTNAYFLLTFLLVALAGLFVLRWLGVSRPVSVVLSVLYAFLPYHFYRGEAHLFLSGYYAVPLGIALAVTATRGNPLFERRAEPAFLRYGRLRRRKARSGRTGLRAWATPRSFATLALAAVIGSSGSYYAAFTLVLLGAAGALHAVRGRALTPALPLVMAAAAIVGVLGLNLLPDAVHRMRHGANERVAQRDPAETDRYGLKLTSMLLPDPDHRVASLGALGARYRGTSDVPSEGGQSLGIIGAAGLLWLLTVGLTSVAGGRTLRNADGPHRTLSFLAIVTLLTGTIGGFSALVAIFLTPQFRSWNRVTVLLAFLSLAAIGLLIDRWWGGRAPTALGPAAAARIGPPVNGGPGLRRRRRGQVGRVAADGDAVRRAVRRRRAVGSAGLAALLLVGLFDQTGGAVPAYRANAAEHDSDRAFVRTIEARLPRGSMIYQLPYVSFPEAAPIHDTGSYDQVRGYLHSDHLRWSYGAVRGRDHGWQDALLGQPLDLVLRRLAAVGFAGLWIDRHGYLDNAVSLEQALSDRLAPPLVSGDGRLSFFSLVDFTAALRRDHPSSELDALTARTLSPVTTSPGDGLQRHREGGATHWFDGEASATLHVTNPSPAPRTATFEARLEAAGPGTVTITWPDHSVEQVPVTAGETPIQRQVVVPPGEHALRFTTDLPAFPAREATPNLRFRLLQPALYDR